MYKPDGGQGSQPELQDEAGSVDNRLSLNPNDPLWADKLKSWKDGERYKLSDLGDLDIIQVSPGEFEIVKSDGSEAATAAEPDEDDAAAGSAYANPAVAKMIGE